LFSARLYFLGATKKVRGETSEISKTIFAISIETDRETGEGVDKNYCIPGIN
jgi:hypothetical protein